MKEKQQPAINPWHPRTDVPSDNRTVLTCIRDHGIPQCLRFAQYDHIYNKWVDLLEDEDEPLPFNFEYWMDIPDLPPIK